MNVGVCYAEADRQLWMRLEVPNDSSVLDAVTRSGILQRFPEIDLNVNKTGVYGKIVALDSPLKEGDRVEIYRAITADPKTVRRRVMDDDDEDDD
ncbi:RnfH family protein [Candidatus Methylospira mobilis]|uniref:UPF0125 protein F6R98_07450 n=1 Tax=Candidatus Methylospira mobilis TaxID=1808979 RepID=A0A5Q0BG12_9GAMM|nr:RnfH family protein [Candidatus Methylospira mobilis]QFY42479.1 RnfH family protein [Candidatus Methylospira mobilis]WNV04410.1 RnfH family protein [Candidatus Methylospira mobilis]